MSNPFFYLIIGILVSMGLGYPAILLAKRFNLMDVPGSAPHKTHAHSTPLAGGILLSATLMVAVFLFSDWLNRQMVVVLTGAAVVFVFGIWDDFKGLAAGQKLAGQLIAACILVSFGVQVHFLTVLFETWHLSLMIAQALNITITLFWVIGITNAMNMIDSMDGIVAGLGGIAFACFFGAMILANQSSQAIWSAVLLGVCVGLYFWNKTAGKFFLGDSGAQTMGFLLASFGIMYNPLNRSPESSWFVPIMLLSVPIFDTTLVVFSRFKRKQPIGSGRRDHTYHRLIAIGYSPRVAVFLTHLAAFIISCVAYLTLYLPPLPAILLFLMTILFGLAALLWLEQRPTLDDQPQGKNDE